MKQSSQSEKSFAQAGGNAEKTALSFIMMGLGSIEDIRRSLSDTGLAAAKDLGIDVRHAKQIVSAVLVQFDKDVQDLKKNPNQPDRLADFSPDEIEDMNERLMSAEH